VQMIASIEASRAATRPADVDWFAPYGPPQDLQGDSPHNWTARTGFWPAEGLRVWHSDGSDERLVMAVEMPWIPWSSEHVTILPNGQIVFQLGEQIMWVDLDHNLAAAVAAGHGPVVVLDNKQPTTTP
jgi:hypothetical protein